ncbi:MAG: homoserine dehydrogenase [Magnetococcus sp. WYHC-3]
MDPLRVGMLGFGTVGTGVARLLLEHGAMIDERAGRPVRLVRIAARDVHNDRGFDTGDIQLTTDVNEVIQARDLDVVVELIGGKDPAEAFVTTALENGMHVVTANKALIAERGHRLVPLAAQRQRELLFEAAVAGTIPIIKSVREALVANRIDSVHGILNGTCNYILTAMRERGLSFDVVLKEAQQKGYAEADPSFDVDGFDAAHKLVILASLAFGMPIGWDKVHVEGIRDISSVDIAWATEMGYRIKLLGIARQNPAGIELRVQPTLVPTDSMIGAVEGVFNAVFVKGDYSGPTLYYGRGAGERPTASAVVADIVDIARSSRVGQTGRIPCLGVPVERLRERPVLDMGAIIGEYYLRLMVEDRPGVLADITAILKTEAISISDIHQKGRSEVAAVPLVLITHEVNERAVQNALARIAALPSVKEKPHCIRIEKGFG